MCVWMRVWVGRERWHRVTFETLMFFFLYCSVTNAEIARPAIQ
jgi:hypothetical protein